MQCGWVRKAAVPGIIFALSLIAARFETTTFIELTPSILRLGPLMAVPLFAHNSLAAAVVALGTYFLRVLAEVLPEKLRRFEAPSHPRAFSAALATLIVLSSVLHVRGVLDFQALLFSAPIAAIEGCAVYFASLAGLLGRLRGVLKAYGILAAGAIAETYVILNFT